MHFATKMRESDGIWTVLVSGLGSISNESCAWPAPWMCDEFSVVSAMARLRVILPMPSALTSSQRLWATRRRCVVETAFPDVLGDFVSAHRAVAHAPGLARMFLVLQVRRVIRTSPTVVRLYNREDVQQKRMVLHIFFVFARLYRRPVFLHLSGVAKWCGVGTC